MPDDTTPPEESNDPQDAIDQAMKEAESAPDEDPATPETPPTPDADASPSDSPPHSAAEQLAQDALDAARAAVSGINSGDPIESPQNDEAQSAIAAAQNAVDGIGTQVNDALGGTSPFEIPNIDAPTNTGELEEGLDLLSDVNLNVKIELGRTRMYLEDVLKLSEGSVVELDKLAGDPVDIYVNDRHVATGEVLILNDNFCVRINDIVASAALENRSA